MTSPTEIDGRDIRELYVKIPARTVMNFLRFDDRRDHIALVFFVLLDFYIQLRIPGQYSWLIGIAIWIMFFLRMTFGRVYIVLGQWFVSQWHGVVNGGVLWMSSDFDGVIPIPAKTDRNSESRARAQAKAEAKAKAKARSNAKKGRPPSNNEEVKPKRHRRPFPNRRPIRLKIYRIGDPNDVASGGVVYTCIYDPVTKADYFVVTGAGSTKNWDLLSAADSNRGFVDVVREVSLGQHKFSVRVTSLDRSRPVDRFVLQRDFQEDYHPMAIALINPAVGNLSNEAYEILAEGFTDQECDGLALSGRLYQQSVAFSALNELDIDQVTIWSIRRTGEWSRAAKRRSLALDDFSASDIKTIIDTVTGGLEQNAIEDPHVLDLAETRDFVYNGLHITDSDEYNAWRMEHLDSVNETEEDTRKRLGAKFVGTPSDFEDLVAESLSPHWPRKYIYQGRDFCIVDGTFIATLVITANTTERQDKLVLPDYYRQINLGARKIHFSQATLSESTNSQLQVLWLTLASGFKDAFSEGTGLRLNTLAAKDRRKRGEARRVELHESGYGADYTRIFSILATSHDQLEADIRTVVNIIKSKKHVAKRVTGAARQFRAAQCANLGLPMM
ncbi:hypothetical protein HJC99_03245 [Candidatus Saccharibacteria bacterium]|nr:hypothetical protein [Candidatus Saccharibacteria bacterium]